MNLKSVLVALLGVLSACGEGLLEDGSAAHVGQEDLTGVTSVERGIHFQSYVYVPANADDGAIAAAIARQVKTAIGALREAKVSLDDRACQSNLDPSKWTRTLVAVATPGQPDSTVLRVDFKYDDRAVVSTSLSSRSVIDLVMLADDYASHAQPLKADCSDDPTTDTDSLWYHYRPQASACKARIKTEAKAIAAEKTGLKNAAGRIGPAEAGRWFASVTAKLDPPKLPATAFSPEYDRLYDLSGGRSQLVVYAFFGVDVDETDPDDLLAREAVKFLRAMLRAQPNFRPVKTAPFTWLLDLYDASGQRIDGVTYEKLFAWILGEGGYPAQVGTSAAAIRDFRRQALAKLTERWIYWDLPMRVSTKDGRTKDVTVEVRWFYGYEDGSFEARQHAQWRYLEAFWHGDVFLYNGHSHFGHGPLEPTLYGPRNFNERYQIMLVNSCISFNYYHEDFLRMKPGGSKNLDMVVNGLPSYVQDGGVATARLLTALIDGRQRTYADLLGEMTKATSFGSYDPMRVVDGELDNAFSQAATPLTVQVLAPVY